MPTHYIPTSPKEEQPFEIIGGSVNLLENTSIIGQEQNLKSFLNCQRRVKTARQPRDKRPQKRSIRKTPKEKRQELKRKISQKLKLKISKMLKKIQNRKDKIPKKRIQSNNNNRKLLSQSNNNLLPPIKLSHLEYILQMKGRGFFQNQPILVQILFQKAPNRQDFVNMYKIPQLREVFRNYFNQKIMERDLEYSNVDRRNLAHWKTLLENFQQAFRQKWFPWIYDPNKVIALKHANNRQSWFIQL